jgi:hypothetical protein
MNRWVGILVIVGGACLMLVGLLIYSGGLNWFGRLPGDVRYESEASTLCSDCFYVDCFSRPQFDLLSHSQISLNSIWQRSFAQISEHDPRNHTK